MTYNSSFTGAQVDEAVTKTQNAGATVLGTGNTPIQSNATNLILESGAGIGIGVTDPTSFNLHAVSSSGSGRIRSEATSGSGYGSFEVRSNGGGLDLISYGTTVAGTGFSNPLANQAQVYSAGQMLGIGTLNANPLVLGTSNTERLRIDSSGNLLVGTTSGTDAKLRVKGGTSDNLLSAFAAFNSSDTALLTVRNDGIIRTGTAALSPYNYTTASAANVNVDATGALARSTSSARYKENIRDYDQQASIDALRPVFFNSKNAGDDKLYAGLIAEEVAEAGFEEFVERNPEGKPDAVFYQHMVALCIKEIQSLRARVAELENKQ